MINEPHGQPSSNQREFPLDEQYDEWKNDGKSGDRKTLQRSSDERERCGWLIIRQRLTNGRTLYRPTGNHQVTDLERSRQTCIRGPILRSIDGASIRSRNSTIQPLIVQSKSINPDCPLPLLFSNSIYR